MIFSTSIFLVLQLTSSLALAFGVGVGVGVVVAVVVGGSREVRARDYRRSLARELSPREGVGVDIRGLGCERGDVAAEAARDGVAVLDVVERRERRGVG
jgi:hypothetical protein